MSDEEFDDGDFGGDDLEDDIEDVAEDAEGAEGNVDVSRSEHGAPYADDGFLLKLVKEWLSKVMVQLLSEITGPLF